MLNPFNGLSTGSGLALYGLGLGLISALMCALVLRLLLETGWAWRLAVDRPNERSLHATVVPRCGGFGIMLTLLLVAGSTSPGLWPVLIGLVLLVVISFLDDRRGMPIVLRFATQIAAVTLVLASQAVGLPWWLVCAIGLAWLWGTNLYNFMDGSDGMVGAMTATGFASYAVASGILNPNLTTVSVVASGSALGFLVFNRPPAKLFLGDVGSIPLGFLAGAVGFLGLRDGRWPAWFPCMVFSPFVADASVTLLRRLFRGEKVWQAHREHYYQRLIQSGFSHGQALAVFGAAMVGSGFFALALLPLDPLWQWMGVASWFVVLAAVGIWIDLRWKRSLATPGAAQTQADVIALENAGEMDER
ncbi:MAG: glycosyltransferase family 4 protein [Burkholderiaceae bacterium]|jgi:UDP-N-acetylmuramyl pentapeptide phosphotransferase/UDP-N-acetylglucosamine-1-phosphate transferase